jgi:hypothetical protein
MTRVTLTPTLLSGDNAISNLTTLLTTGGNPNAVVPSAGAGNGVQFNNVAGLIQFGVSLGATACTATVQVGMQGLPGLSPTTYPIVLPTSAIGVIAAFHSIVQQSGTKTIQIDFSSNTGLVVALFQLPAVY